MNHHDQDNLMGRRNFMQLALVGSATYAVKSFLVLSPAQAKKVAYSGQTDRFEIQPLPYALDALEPHISKRTIQFHYGKHHRSYMKKTKAEALSSNLSERTLEEIIINTAGKAKLKTIFNNAAQAWNHSFYWKSMKPKGGGKPSGALAEALKKQFGDLDQFKKQFSKAASSHFGSGWVWLIKEGQELKVISTDNADTPIAHGQQPLLTLDVWEHAYYLDYQNRRKDYIEAYLEHLLNWDFAVQNYGLVKN